MSNKNKNDGLKVERVYTSDVIKDLLKDLEYKEKRFVELAERNKRLSDKLTKVKEILQVVFDKWKEERWILQSEEEVRKIENLMEQAEQFLSSMRSFTEEEQKNYTKSIRKVYKKTGAKLFESEVEK